MKLSEAPLMSPAAEGRPVQRRVGPQEDKE